MYGKGEGGGRADWVWRGKTLGSWVERVAQTRKVARSEGMWGGNWRGRVVVRQDNTGGARRAGILSALQDAARDWNAGSRYSTSRNASVLGAR